MKKIEIKANYNFDTYNEFANFNFYKKNKGSTFLILSIILVIFDIICLFAFGFDTLYLFSLIIICVACTTLFYRKKIGVKKYYESIKSTYELETIYEFYEDNYSISNEKAKGTYEYKDINIVCETDDAFYIYVSTISAFAIPKSFMDDKTASKFKKLLEEKAPKYKYYK